MNPLQRVADRLGLMVYLFVMNGGRPGWRNLLDERAALIAPARARPVRPAVIEQANPFEAAATPGREREEALAG